MRLWSHRADAMSHNYALVGYLLSPNPTIMKHALDHKSKQHDDAVVSLINKLLVNKELVGDERTKQRANLVHLFWKEYSDFTLHMGKYSDPEMWLIAQDPTQHAYMWHKIYSLSRTKVLGKLACLVTSKNLGIGSAERHWKIVKAAKNGQRNRLGSDKTKMQALIYGTAMQKKQRYRQDQLRAAGKL